MSDREDPYCTHCGSGSLRYDYECASGIVYQCKRCGNEFQWSPPKDDEGTAEIRAPRDTGGMSNELPPLPGALTDDEIQEIGRQCIDQISMVGRWELLEFAERISRAAVAAERERCAKVCEAEAADTRAGCEHTYASAIELCARLIRKG
jgi:hypothetical protein